MTQQICWLRPFSENLSIRAHLPKYRSLFSLPMRPRVYSLVELQTIKVQTVCVHVAASRTEFSSQTVTSRQPLKLDSAEDGLALFKLRCIWTRAMYY